MNKFLKYLFVVRFQDGSFYEQTEDDKARICTEGSCFSDVLHIHKTNPMEQAALTDGKDTWVLDLVAGDFSFNAQTKIRLHDRDCIYHNKRLVLFRRRYLNPETNQEDNDKIQYALGWQANTSDQENAENKQFVIFID